jgi:S-adenosylmethionine:tRNA ribosyltransferase-isomerase
VNKRQFFGDEHLIFYAAPLCHSLQGQRIVEQRQFHHSFFHQTNKEQKNKQHHSRICFFAPQTNIVHPQHLQISDFTYELPDERIAKFPLPERDDSKLLIYEKETITENQYKNIDQFLPSETLLVFNQTKVVQARLLFEKASGGTIEIFCLEPSEEYADITTAMLQTGNVLWKCLVGGAKKWKEEWLRCDFANGFLQASIKEKLADYFIIAFQWQPADLSFADVLILVGKMPLPPYLNRAVETSDKERYQTIYAKNDGSVAAPTAGLHFTQSVMQKLVAKNIQQQFVTLHVGAGTFKPVKSETIEGHEMHAEFMDIELGFIENLVAQIQMDKPVVAVGTTSLRSIESLYWMGLKIKANHAISLAELEVKQWQPYETVEQVNAVDALTALINWMQKNEHKRLLTKTQIMIAPGYQLKIANGLITNFHQPQSTLLLLIAAIVGHAWKRIYAHAMQNDFRFLSYGDGCLLWAE